ncbi:MAG TPA: polysaccharide biosynthesis tyrosine autokinase [Gemmatimonadota bacterium]|nr:polysaccharide biosynthesis tyrosine autokinase [Gemmatimonadota bacterium]
MSSLLRRHLWLIGIIVALSVAAAAWLASREAPKYQASAMIRLTRIEPPVGANIDPMLSEMVVLTGRTVIGNAVDREGLRLFSSSTGAPAGFVERVEVSLLPQRSATIDLDLGENEIAYGTEADHRTAAYGEPIRLDGASFVVSARPLEGAATVSVVPRDRAIDYALENLTAITDPSTGGVQVVFTSTERRIASRAVNAIVEAYQAVSAETARQDVRRRRAFLEEELRVTDSLLAVAQAELGSLRSREEGAQLQARLQADVELYESVLNRILDMRRSGEGGDPSSLMSLPVIAVDPVARRLYSQLVAYRMERQGMLTGPQARTPQHPDVQRLNTLIASTEGSLVEAARDRIRSLRAQAAAAGPVHSRDSATAGERAGAELDDLLLPRNLEVLQQTAEELRDKYREARLEESSETGPVEIVQLSSRTTPVRSIAWIKLLLGLAAGLILGGAAAVARERFADSIGHRREVREIKETADVEEIEVVEEIEETTPVPNLAVIPEVTPSLVEPVVKGDFRPGPLQSAGMEAYRTLRANLVSSRWGIKTLVVTSAHPGEGKTTTSTNLAATYARQGLKVVLVECDLRRPSLGRYFGISKDTDLMDVLFENRDWRKAIQLTKMPGLYVLLGEKSFPRAGESLGGPEMKRLLAELSSEYDMVILDTSPLLVSEDATALGPIVDGVLLVVRATRTDRVTVEGIVRKLRLAGANVVGTILNDPEGVGPLS